MFYLFWLIYLQKSLTGGQKIEKMLKSLAEMAIRTHNHSFGLVCVIHGMSVVYIL